MVGHAVVINVTTVPLLVAVAAAVLVIAAIAFAVVVDVLVAVALGSALATTAARLFANVLVVAADGR